MTGCYGDFVASVHLLKQTHVYGMLGFEGFVCTCHDGVDLHWGAGQGLFQEGGVPVENRLFL